MLHLSKRLRGQQCPLVCTPAAQHCPHLAHGMRCWPRSLSGILETLLGFVSKRLRGQRCPLVCTPAAQHCPHLAHGMHALLAPVLVRHPANASGIRLKAAKRSAMPTYMHTSSPLVCTPAAQHCPWDALLALVRCLGNASGIRLKAAKRSAMPTCMHTSSPLVCTPAAQHCPQLAHGMRCWSQSSSGILETLLRFSQSG